VLSLVAVPSLVALVLLADLAGAGEVAAAVVVVGLLVGVPHGALDHLVPAYHRTGLRRSVLGTVLVAYVAVAVVVWGLWQLYPAVAVALFLALSCAHFGTGETGFARLRDGGPEESPWPAGLVTGAVVVLLPVAAHRAEVAPYLDALVPAWDGVVPALPALATAALVVAAALALAVRRVVQGHRLQAAEVLVLLGSALVAPAAVSIAVYFGAWHSVRHLALMLGDDPANRAALVAGRLAAPARRLAVRAVVPSAAALGVLALLWWSVDGDLYDFVATDVALLAALTVPHALVVWWSDRVRTGA
jgi:Brp/Blh family beta-carotene 15,15'-monooxygenase